MEKLHRCGMSAVLPADPDLEIGADLATFVHAHLDQPADAALVEALERIDRQDAALEALNATADAMAQVAPEAASSVATVILTN